MSGNDTLLLDRGTWDLTLDADGNIAVAREPYSLAQDAASAIRAFRGECQWDVALGVPYLTRVFVGNPSTSQIKALLIAAAESVPGVASAQVFLTGLSGRSLSGQVQVTGAATGEVSAVDFEVVNPQGAG